VPPPTPVTTAKNVKVTSVCRFCAAASAPDAEKTAMPTRSSVANHKAIGSLSMIGPLWGLYPLAVIPAKAGISLLFFGKGRRSEIPRTHKRSATPA
jgi:hypothetical protein